MAFRRTLSERLLGCRRAPPPPPAAAICSSPAPASDPAQPMRREYITVPEPGGRGLVPRFLQRRSLTQFTGGLLPEILSLPVGERLRERLRSIGVSGNRLNLDGLSSPAPAAAAGDTVQDLSVLDARKLLRLALMERLKAELREISESSIPYGRYLEICSRACENVDQGLEFAKMMDDSGSVIVLGNVVFLRPEQVAKSMEAILHQWTVMPNDPRRAELDQMEEQKSEIDRKARAQVRAELYCGLGLMAAQTLGFMRLTFWELSWDVMEPICFFVTSLHFALAYCFFLRTSNEPSLEGYFNCRFRTKQEKLMRAHNFDVERYNELYRIFYPNSTGPSRGKERYPALDHAGTNCY